MQTITEYLNTFASWAVAISSIVAVLSLIFKPIRKIVSRIIRAIVGKRDDTVIAELKRVEATFIDRCETLEKKIDRVAEENKENERDRLRSEIFRFGNIARHGGAIASEEFRSLQGDYEKYKNLGGNGIVKSEYEFILEYYNKNEWRSHHGKAEQV